MDRRVARTKRNIYAAFFSLLQKKPMNEITVTELAKAADIDRKTFYAHYQTVQDVFEEFKQSVYDRVMEILAECEARGADTEDGFDFVYFYDALHEIMTENLAFFEKLSKDTGFMFLKNEFKNVLKQAILDYYEGWGGKSPYQLSLYAEFISAGAIHMWTDWLHHKQVPIEEFRDSAIEVLREAWKMGE